jgi:hypothetical protein
MLMGTKDPRVDAYIEKSADFAKPILKKLRALVHKGCPDVVETIKWSMPAFEYKGPFCGMASFKQHCAFGFWKAAILFAEERKNSDRPSSWGAPGKDPLPAKIISLDDLPSDATFLALIKKAVKLNDEGVKIPAKKTDTKKALKMLPDFAAALKKTKGATANFDAFSPSCQREYIEWIAEAKKDETRQKRIATAVEWIAEGKHRNWKYQKR